MHTSNALYRSCSRCLGRQRAWGTAVNNCGRLAVHRSCSSSHEPPQAPRFNPLNIQMLSEALHEQIFPNTTEPVQNHDLIKKSKEHLSSHELWGKPKSAVPDVKLTLPPLLGANIDEHFRTIAEQQSRPYHNMAQYIAESELPPMPEEWEYSAGWSKYEVRDGAMHVAAVDFPVDDALVFDVEVLQTEGLFPTLAVAASPNAWYSWVSPKLVEDKSYQWLVKRTPDLYIPLETRANQVTAQADWRERLVIGHSVAYDRSYVKEQYYIKGPKTHFLDTLSLHMCVSGLTGLQRNMWTAAQSGRKTQQDWMQIGCANKLADLYRLYCDGEVDKSLVEVFIHGSMDDVRANFQDLMSYCAKDVSITHEVFSTLWPLFLVRFPHPVTFAGMLEMSSAYLPVDGRWEEYLQDADNTFDDLEQEMKGFLMHLADEACNYQHGKRFSDDPWLWNLDWSVQDVKTKILKKPKKRRKTKQEKENENASVNEAESHEQILGKTCVEDSRNGTELDSCLDEESEECFDEWSLIKMERNGKAFTVDESRDYVKGTTELLSSIPSAVDIMYKRRQHLPGYPLWYRKLCPKNRELGASLVSPQCQTAPSLLRMTWDGFPLHYSRKHGWGYLVPGRTDNLESRDSDAEDEKIERPGPESPFPTKAFQALWRQHEMNKGANPTADPDFLDSDDLHVRDLTDSDLWSEYEHDEMRRRKSSAVTSENQATAAAKAKTFSRGRRNSEGASTDRRLSKPEHYHGVGPFNDVDFPGVWFFRIPHKDGEQYRCGNPLAKDYISKLDDGTLVTAGDRSARRTLIINKMISSWRNAQKRIKSQMPVWTPDDVLPSEVTRSHEYAVDGVYGAIIPRVTPAGTVTRRAVEPTWLTASNPREDRVGSELKSLVRAPPGYCLVGADVDSQELWIAAVLGDANFAGMHGSTAFGWMTLQGQKSDGTDLHSKTATTIGISRDHAKIFNYGRIYGAGQKFAERLLLQFNHRLTDTEAKQKAQRLYASTKGTVRYSLSDYGHEVAHELGYAVDKDGCVEPRLYWELVRRTARRRKNKNSKKSVEAGRRWHGGSESEMFNKLEMIAQSDEPRTPVLGCRISRALEPWVVGNEFITSRVNWVVQSSAVDYLHLMLVAMKWLFTEYDINGRFCISIHDEVRYLVSSEDRYRAALALQITNLLTRAMFAYKLGMNDLPQSVAFFSAVDIDKVLRKEVNLDCKTPSNPQGLEKGQGIRPGEALDIYEILKRTNNGCLTKEHENQKSEAHPVS